MVYRLVERGGSGGPGGKRTRMMSLRTLGTSEKKKSTNTPATTPNDPAVVALCLKRDPLVFRRTKVRLKIHAFQGSRE